MTVPIRPDDNIFAWVAILPQKIKNIYTSEAVNER